MTLTPEQKQAVASWIAAGDNLSAVQKKLAEQFKLTLTYMDVRFLVDDLDLTLKDPAPPPEPAPKVPPSPAAANNPNRGMPPPQPAPQQRDPMDDDDDLASATDDQSYSEEDTMPAADTADTPTNVRLEVDNVTVIPGAIASGSVVFSDGVSGKWMVDNYGRPGFTQISQDGYRPTPADAEAFMRELSAALQKKGF